MWFRLSEGSKKVGINQALWKAVIENDQAEHGYWKEWELTCPSIFGNTLRMPNALSGCHQVEVVAPWSIRTFPADGVPEVSWQGRRETDVEAHYKDKTRSWDTKDGHSYLNMDEAYKTKFIITQILQ